jgi:hypothetical protein
LCLLVKPTHGIPQVDLGVALTLVPSVVEEVDVGKVSRLPMGVKGCSTLAPADVVEVLLGADITRMVELRVMEGSTSTLMLIVEGVLVLDIPRVWAEKGSTSLQVEVVLVVMGTQGVGGGVNVDSIVNNGAFMIAFASDFVVVYPIYLTLFSALCFRLEFEFNLSLSLRHIQSRAHHIFVFGHHIDRAVPSGKLSVWKKILFIKEIYSHTHTQSGVRACESSSVF